MAGVEWSPSSAIMDRCRVGTRTGSRRGSTIHPTTVADVRSRVADVRSRHLFILPIPATSSRYSGMLIGPQWIVERVLVSESLWKFGTRLVFQFIATSEAVPELGSRTDGPPETRVGKSRRRDRGR